MSELVIYIIFSNSFFSTKVFLIDATSSGIVGAKKKKIRESKESACGVSVLAIY